VNALSAGNSIGGNPSGIAINAKPISCFCMGASFLQATQKSGINTNKL
jgi:hypothetical protein